MIKFSVSPLSASYWSYNRVWMFCLIVTSFCPAAGSALFSLAKRQHGCTSVMEIYLSACIVQVSPGIKKRERHRSFGWV